MASRRPSPDSARHSYVDGLTVLAEWLRVVPGDRWTQPSVLPGWTVADLSAHLILVARSAARLAPSTGGATALSIAQYIDSYPDVATRIAAAAHDAAQDSGGDGASIALAIRDELGRAEAVLERIGPDIVVQAGRGPIRLADYLRTRAIEIAVHADDLARSVPDLPPPSLPRDVTRIAVRATLEALAEKVPGRAVEVRVPPFAAVQCVAGPRHTRGTPSNVVELDSITWLRLAAGREPWDVPLRDGRIRASGERADLSGWLPLF